MSSAADKKRKLEEETGINAIAAQDAVEATSKKQNLDRTSASESSSIAASPASMSSEEAAAPPPLAREERLLQPHHVEQLKVLGYTVVEGVVSADACRDRHARLLDEMSVRGVNWKDPSVIRSAGPQVHGIVQHLEIGHAAPVWEMRQEERVARVFEELYGDNDLLVSFDGICLWRESDVDDGKRWWHVDQSHTRRGLRCIQGSIVMAPCAGGLAVLPRSHAQHTTFARDVPRAATNKKDWFKFEEKDGMFEFTKLQMSTGTQPLVVTASVGSLVLWDSRLAHMAQMAPIAAPAPQRTRCVVYVCYQPRRMISDALLKKKCKAFDEYRMTSHWPASNVTLFPTDWRKWNDKPQAAHYPTPEQRTRVETPRMLELAGKTPLTTRARRVSAPALAFVK